MVVVGLIAVVVVSVVIARVGIAWLERPLPRRPRRDHLPPTAETVIDLREPALESWARRGFTSREAATWMEHGLDPDVSFLFRTLGVDPPTAARLLRSGMNDDSVVAWRIVGWELDEALPWFVARFEPAPALAWREHGFDPDEARAWRHEHFGVRQAAAWRRLGDTPAQARDVVRRFEHARVTVTEGLQLLDEGFTVDEICAGEAGAGIGARRPFG